MNDPEVTILVGSGRSGTTYLARMLTEALDIGMYQMGEPKFIIPMYLKIAEFGNLEKVENLERLVRAVHATLPFRNLRRIHNIQTTPEELLERVTQPSYRGVLYAALQLIAEKLGKTRLGFKDPMASYHMPTLAQIFPNARFVHIIRDGRDCALSFKRQKWGPNNVYSGATYWNESVGIARHDGRNLGERYFEVRFEDVLTDTVNTVPPLVDFINQGKFIEQADQLVKHINHHKQSDSVTKWRTELSPGQRYVFEAVAGEMLASCGYETEFDGKATVRLPHKIFYRGHDLALRIRNYLVRDLEPE
jgi:hypothetical protein